MRGKFGPTRLTRRQRIQRLRERTQKPGRPPVVYRFMAVFDCGHYYTHGDGSGMTATI